MNTIDKINITECAVIRPDCFAFETAFSDSCRRFFKFASMMPEGTYLGMRISFSRDALPEPVAFSSGGLCMDDYVCMFGSCAKVTPAAVERISSSSSLTTLLIRGSDCADSEKLFSVKSLSAELSRLDASLDIIVPAGAGDAYVSVSSAGGLPLRVRVMLSSLFCGAEVLRAEDCENVKNSGLSRAVVSGIMQSLLFNITENSVLDQDGTDCSDISGIPSDAAMPLMIEDLDLSVRAYNCLKRVGVKTAGELFAMTREDLMNVRNLGKKGLEEVWRRIAEYRSLSAASEAEDGYLPDASEAEERSLPDAEKAEDNEISGREMLNSLIGLEGVKDQVRRIAAFAVMQQDMERQGRKADPITLSMVFSGNPGTAKTTVARIFAKIFCEIGILKKTEIVEVGRADLVAKYEGQTAVKVKDVFARAKGGVLFIDEAYSLVETYDGSFGDEAINTIVQEMENNREDTIVIFAGYPDKMAEFISRNPGLRSRVPFSLEFPDYPACELAQISAAEAEKRGFSISPKAAGKLSAICGAAAGDPEMGNGRFCRSLIENAILNYAFRLYGDEENSASDVESDRARSARDGAFLNELVLTAEDLTPLAGPMRTAVKKAPIGFCI